MAIDLSTAMHTIHQSTAYFGNGCILNLNGCLSQVLLLFFAKWQKGC